MVEEKYPFSEIEVGKNTYIRKFGEITEDFELQWHFDEEDRIIESVGQTDWKFQFDDKFPQPIEGRIFIPKGVWHRVIKGSGCLEILLHKIK
jgi:hypothetical protein